jgi:hypothetical protein
MEWLPFSGKEVLQMQRQHVTSTDIRSIGYDLYNAILEIEFNSGGIYRYTGVPSSTHNSLMSASSHGKFFHAFIKESYPTTRVS